MAEIFRTGHEINEVVCHALADGFKDDAIGATYGILRGAGEWAADRRRHGERTLVLDKGYFKAGHYDGYYRLAWTGTQDPYEDYSPDPSRWEALGRPILPWRRPDQGEYVLLCPPTPAVAAYFGLGTPDGWGLMVAKHLYKLGCPVVVRTKDSAVPLQTHLDKAAAVVTFNSGVGWEALRQGIPVVSDPVYSTVGSFLGTTLADLGTDMTGCDRRALFSFMANRQFTLQEIRTGLARRYVL